MGFFDNLKAAMQNGAQAANAHIERERAKQAAQAPQQRTADTRTGAQDRPRTSSGSRLPEGVVQADLNKLDPIDLGMNAQGQNVKLKISGVMRVKPFGVCTMDDATQRTTVRSIVRNVIEREMAPQINSMGDLKFLIQAGTRLSPIITEELKASGWQSTFTIPLIIRPI
ncbi:MAG: hypothetical protein J5379_04400 [Clostridiales bacterium]|nr:hypothetical protein [Clostridiales bacterium]